MNTSILTENELHKLTDLPSIDIGKSTVYSRVILSGVLYSSALYHRSETTNDSVISIRRIGTTEIGTIQKFISCCTKDCTSCGVQSFCRHFTIVSTNQIHPFDQTSETAQHIIRIGLPT